MVTFLEVLDALMTVPDVWGENIPGPAAEIGEISKPKFIDSKKLIG
jgi:hypothetical protein